MRLPALERNRALLATAAWQSDCLESLLTGKKQVNRNY